MLSNEWILNNKISGIKLVFLFTQLQVRIFKLILYDLSNGTGNDGWLRLSCGSNICHLLCWRPLAISKSNDNQKLSLVTKQHTVTRNSRQRRQLSYCPGFLSVSNCETRVLCEQIWLHLFCELIMNYVWLNQRHRIKTHKSISCDFHKRLTIPCLT